MTGAFIPDSEILQSQSWLNQWLTENAIGWSIENYQNPKGTLYNKGDQILKDVIAGAGGYVFADNNDYKVTINYSGSLEFVSTPSKIDFGSHNISADNQHYEGKLDSSVIISDTRSQTAKSPWHLSVSQSSPIQEIVNPSSGTLIQTGISFDKHLIYGNTVLNTQDFIIYNSNNDDVMTTVIDNTKPSPFDLSVPIEFQKSFATFKGEITWTLSSTP